MGRLSPELRWPGVQMCPTRGEAGAAGSSGSRSCQRPRLRQHQAAPALSREAGGTCGNAVRGCGAAKAGGFGGKGSKGGAAAASEHFRCDSPALVQSVSKSNKMWMFPNKQLLRLQRPGLAAAERDYSCYFSVLSSSISHYLQLGSNNCLHKTGGFTTTQCR